MLLCIHSQEIANTTYNFKDFFTLASPIVVVIIFIIDRLINYKLRKKEIQRNWYLKVLIEPSINNISKFYTFTYEQYVSSSIFLSAQMLKSHNSYNSAKSIEFGKFQARKREFEAEVVFPIQLCYHKISVDTTSVLQELEDLFTSMLDQEKFSKSDIDFFQNFAANNRSNFLQILSLPIHK